MFNKDSLQLYKLKYFFGEKHSWQYKHMGILLQEFNPETKIAGTAEQFLD